MNLPPQTPNRTLDSSVGCPVCCLAARPLASLAFDTSGVSRLSCVGAHPRSRERALRIHSQSVVEIRSEHSSGGKWKFMVASTVTVCPTHRMWSLSKFLYTLREMSDIIRRYSKPHRQVLQSSLRTPARGTRHSTSVPAIKLSPNAQIPADHTSNREVIQKKLMD